MELKTLDDVRKVAEVLPGWSNARQLSKHERLERWAEVLKREGGRRLRTLFEIEYAPPDKRAVLRADGSPLSVAFSDHRLREDGLAGDTVGDAVAYFGISETELHNILCFCHSGETMSADLAAARVRVAAARAIARQPLHAPPAFFGGLVAVLVAVGVLVI